MKSIKKIMALCLTLCLVVCAFTACNKDGKKNDNKKEDSKKVKVIDIKLTEEDYAFAVDKDNKQLLKDVNEFVKEVKEDGTLEKLTNKYFTGEGEIKPVVSAEEDSSKDQLVVATNAAFNPFEFKQGDKFVGIDMELAKLLADKLGKELVIKNMKFDAVLNNVAKHKCDIAMAGLTVNEKRKKTVNFAEPYFKSAQKLIVNDNNTKFDKCTTVEDVEKILNSFDSKTKIGAQNGTSGQFYTQGDEGFGYKGFKVTYKPYDNGSMAVQDMINGNIDYVIIDEAPADCIVKSINSLA